MDNEIEAAVTPPWLDEPTRELIVCSPAGKNLADYLAARGVVVSEGVPGQPGMDCLVVARSADLAAVRGLVWEWFRSPPA